MPYLVSNSVKDYTVEDYTDKEQHYAKALVPGSLKAFKSLWNLAFH